MNTEQDARALARWEGEGGRVLPARPGPPKTSLGTSKADVEEQNKRVQHEGAEVATRPCE
jgi:hypothetical protein